MFLKTISLIIITISVILISSFSNAQEIKRAKYGEHCNQTVRCDTSVSLTCRNSSCDCYKPDTMFYDPIIKSCLVLVGEKCRFQIGSDNEDPTNSIPAFRRNFQEEMDCVQNAWCNRSGVCMCSGDYVELGNGTCISKRNYGESCNSDTECRQDSFLSCIDGQCGCNVTVSTYNVLLRQCVGKVGKPCIGLDGCVYNAECTSSENSKPSWRSWSRQQALGKTCSCNPGFIADSEGFCKMGLGGQCSATQPCASSFKCKDGQCTCQFDNVQLALLKSQTCLSLVGGPCNETETLYQCVDNSHCASNNASGLYECRCNDGFIENNDGTCDLAYGSSCEAPTGRPWSKRIPCDRMTPLFCVDGTCQCQSELYTFNGNGTCLGKYGAKCQRFTESISDCIGSGGSSSHSSENQFNCMGKNKVIKEQCTGGAECVGKRGMNTTFGRCLCSEGYTVAVNRTCVKIN